MPDDDSLKAPDRVMLGNLRLFQDNEFLNSPAQGNTRLILAAGDEDYATALRCVQAGEDVNARNVHDQSALHWSAEFAWNDLEAAQKIVDLLLEYGADINAQDDRGVTALMHAGSRGNVTLLRHLLERGANPNLRRDDGSPEGATLIGFLESAPSLRRGRKTVIKITEKAGGTR